MLFLPAKSNTHVVTTHLWGRGRRMGVFAPMGKGVGLTMSAPFLTYFNAKNASWGGSSPYVYVSEEQA